MPPCPASISLFLKSTLGATSLWNGCKRRVDWFVEGNRSCLRFLNEEEDGKVSVAVAWIHKEMRF